MRPRGGDVAFYSLLVCVATVAITLSLLPLHRSSPSPSAATTASTGHAANTIKSPAGPAPLTKRVRTVTPRRARLAPLLTIDAARGRSWIVIRAGSSVGPVLYRGILEQGRRIHVRRRIVWAQVGAVASVDVRIGRRRIELGRAALTGVMLKTRGAAAAQSGSPVGVIGS